MRRILLAAAVTLAGLALGTVALVATGFVSPDGAPARKPPATTTTGAPTATAPSGPGETSSVLTTPPGGGPLTSPGSAPIAGALLSLGVTGGRSVNVDDDADCRALDPEVTLLACARARGSGGHFLVTAVRHRDGGLEARLYRGTGAEGLTFRPLLSTEVFPPETDVFGLALLDAVVDGEAVVVVDYDFDGSGSVHSFDVVAWEEGRDEPGVVAHVGGTGQDRVEQVDSGLRFVSANYDDGAPTCCPNLADVRTLTRSGPGRWRLTTRTVPFASA